MIILEAKTNKKLVYKNIDIFIKYIFSDKSCNLS